MHPVAVVVSILFGTLVVAFFTWEYFLYYYGYEIDVMVRHVFKCAFNTDNVSLVAYENNSWELLLERYEKNRNPEKFVIFVPLFWQGLCNRILNSVSVMLFAIATNRTVWIEWGEVNRTSISAVEFGGMVAYDDLFNASFPTKRPPTLHADYMPNEFCVSRLVQFGNLHALDDHKIVHLNRHDFYGTHLMKNRRYKDTVFKDLDVYKGFPILFQRMFALKKPIHRKTCSWFIQYRTVWPPPFHTAPFDDYIKCAKKSGLTPENYSTTHVISDNPMMIVQRSSPETRRVLDQMNLPRSKVTCRGKCGDLKSMQTMYELSGCKNAIVSLGSSFGACIAGLANVENWYRVGHDGACTRMKHGLVDANCNTKHGCFQTYLANL